MTKRIFVLMMVVALLIPVMASTSLAQDDVTLTWRTRPDNQAEIDLYQTVSDTIDENWEGVTLEYQPGGSESASYQDVLIAELTAGEAPDVFWIPGTDVARFAKLGLIMNLADLAEADEDFSVDDFYPQIMQHVTVPLEEGEDALWGVPRDASAFAVYYNADLFDDAGVDYPEADWAWEDFREAAEEINALGDDTFGFGMNNWWANYGYWINAAGSSFFNEDFSACGLDNEATVAGLEFPAGLYADNIATPYGEDAEPPFLAGQVGMFLNGRWATPNMVANADFNWNVAEMPAGPDGQSNWLFWGAYVVNAETEHPEEAWDLVTRLTSGEVQGQVAGLGANIPSRTGGSAVDDFLATFPDLDLNNEAFVNGLGYGVAENPVWAGDWPTIVTAYDNAVASVYAGDMSPEEFADSICDQVADAFDSAE
jgi:multiple sugar transport system substrate-binding protein